MVEIEGSAVVDQNAPSSVFDKQVRLVKGGTIQSGERSSPAPWQPLDAYRTYGGQSDLFGTTLSYTDVNSANFGVAISVDLINAEARIDHIRITVYYTDAAGQTWATSGDADDFILDTTGKTAQRTAVSDADINTGRYAVAGTTVLTDQVVGIKCKRGALTGGSSERLRQGSIARYVDNNNWLFFGPDVEALSSPITDTLRLIKRVAGIATQLDSVTIQDSTEWRAVYLEVDRRGRYFCWGSLMSRAVPQLFFAGQDSDLATGGALDDGKGTFSDAKTGALANTRDYDDFVMWIPPLKAAIYEGRSVQLTDHNAEQETQGGVWSKITAERDYLRLAPGGAEERRNRLVFIASPNDPETMGVGFPKKLKVALYATPRYRTVSEP